MGWVAERAWMGLSRAVIFAPTLSNGLTHLMLLLIVVKEMKVDQAAS